MTRRSRCRSRILADRKARGRLIDSWRASRAGAARSAGLVASRRLMVGLLVGGRPGQLLRDDAAERQERPMTVGLGKGLPKLRQRDAPGWLRGARGGADRAGRRRMRDLPGGPV